MSEVNYVIIGGSAAGVTAAETLRKHDRKSNITLVSDEQFALYSRCLLTYLIAGSLDQSKLYFKDKDFYRDNNIKTYLGEKAVSLDRKKKAVFLEDKTEIPYDKLLLATGASAQGVNLPGSDKKGVFTVRNISDARAIIKTLDNVREVVVLGGGLIGLRDAYALSLRGKRVTVVVKSAQVLSQMIDPEAADIIVSAIKEHRIKIITGVEAKEIIGGESIEAVRLDNNEKLDSQLMIIGKGVIPNTELASSSGIKVGDGIVVGHWLNTSDENIFAAGDAAETDDITRETKRINALWPCAVEQGEIAALNMLGKQEVYCGSLSMNSVDFFNLSCISMGITRPKNEENYEIISKTGRNKYKKLIIKGNRIVGMILIGDIRIAGIINTLIKEKIDISVIKHQLLEDAFNYAKIIPLVKEFPESFKQEEYQDTIVS